VIEASSRLAGVAGWLVSPLEPRDNSLRERQSIARKCAVVDERLERSDCGRIAALGQSIERRGANTGIRLGHIGEEPRFNVLVLPVEMTKTVNRRGPRVQRLAQR